MTILVSGATGFVGNYVVYELLKQGHQVIATSKNQQKARSYEWFPKVQYIPCDLNTVHHNLFQFFRDPEMVIHLAWEGLPNYQEMFHVEKNLFSHYFFLKNMLEHGLKHLVVTGTCAEYGMQNGRLYEEMETSPNTPYSLAKDTLRRFLEQLQKTINFEFKWIRLFYMYGKGQNTNALLSQLEQALNEGKFAFNMSGGEQLRDYLAVQKAAEYIVKIAMQNRATGIVNCCSGVPISIRALVESYLKEKQQHIHLNLGYYPYLDYEPMAFWGSTDKLRQILSDACSESLHKESTA